MSREPIEGETLRSLLGRGSLGEQDGRGLPVVRDARVEAENDRLGTLTHLSLVVPLQKLRIPTMRSPNRESVRWIMAMLAIGLPVVVARADDSGVPDLERAQIAFACALGAAVPGTSNCFRANDRYAACFHLYDDGSIGAIAVVPQAWVAGQDFDWDRSLSEGEYLGVIDRLSKIEPLGDFLSGDRSLVHDIYNSSYDLEEEWRSALVSRQTNADHSIRSFHVLYYRHRSGLVVWHQPQDCTAIVDNGIDWGSQSGCRKAAVGPYTLSIDGADYFLAAPDQKNYLPGEHVEVLTAGPVGSFIDASQVQIESPGTTP
jgi:hypothetical protein